MDLVFFLFPPGPVNGIVDLSGRLGVAGQAGFGYLRTALKILFKLFKLPMVSRRFGHHLFNHRTGIFCSAPGSRQAGQAENQKQPQNEKYFQ